MAERKPRVLIVDDDPADRDYLSIQLGKAGCEVSMAEDGLRALEALDRDIPDVILCDLHMPRMDGMKFLSRIKGQAATRLIPVVMLTGQGDTPTKVAALHAGVDGFLPKPADPVELEALLRNLSRLKLFTDDLENADAVLFALAEGVEAKDPNTAYHCKRLSTYSVMLGEALGLPLEDLAALRKGGVLHDLGKVGIPDRILLKPGPLTPEEWAVMKKHPVIGERICRPMRSMRGVLPIIRHHHERWDGTGYPDGLKGEAIPLTARILQVVDAHDALRTRRPYKPPFSKEKAMEILRGEMMEGKWDPKIMNIFLKILGGQPLPLEETYTDEMQVSALR